MKLKDLQQKGGFVDAAPVEKQLTWTRPNPDGGEELSDTFTIQVKRQSFGSMERAVRPDPKDPERSRNAAIISGSILLGDSGEEQISYAEAMALAPSLALLFLEAIAEVNGNAGPKP